MVVWTKRFGVFEYDTTVTDMYFGREKRFWNVSTIFSDKPHANVLTLYVQPCPTQLLYPSLPIIIYAMSSG